MSTQTLLIENFPRPDIARALSPNGRAHWTAKRKARLNVVDVVTVYAIRSGLRRMQGPVQLRVVYTMPDQRKRDQDNYSGGGVTKAVVDCLVKGAWLEGDDTTRLRIEPVEIRVEKGVRRLELQFEESAYPSVEGEQCASVGAIQRRQVIHDHLESRD